ncbi:hypothetical protein L202_05672 [Cryptococcus amylolentus CBS 6039]|uniref:Uncharacterized protein n=1 Tax=Cryptococcus amylolentus CBS 6039 TaxID=1295533 RepID=A0A1E3HLB2_9TREE|nr:hypothetical protein L202_05672 [Cryptococcus amylolentus CBS 6039]ODN77142.1 hypothetical protein L202_05672 [Cryptococcus amylolentus CBS 6039]
MSAEEETVPTQICKEATQVAEEETVPTTISEHATQTAERFVNTLNSNLGAYGIVGPASAGGGAMAVRSLAAWVQSAIEAENADDTHAEGWTEDHSLQNVKIQAGGIAIDSSGRGCTVINATVQGDGWVTKVSPKNIEFNSYVA